MAPLDAEEQALLDAVERGEWQSVPDLGQEIDRYRQSAQSQLQPKVLSGSGPNQPALPPATRVRAEVNQVLQTLATRLNISESLFRERFPTDPLVQVLEEIAVLEAVEQNALQSVPHVAAEIQRYQHYAEAQVSASETIHIKLPNSDLQALREVAQQSGTSVSLLMESVLHQFVINHQQ